MARVRITLSRPTTAINWGREPTEEEFNLFRVKYISDPAVTSVVISDDELGLVITREGSPEACQEFYNELTNPDSAFYGRLAYYAENGMLHTYELLE
jgi:hypothetical protein